MKRNVVQLLLNLYKNPSNKINTVPKFMTVEMHFVFLQQVSHKKGAVGCNIPPEKLAQFIHNKNLVMFLALVLRIFMTLYEVFTSYLLPQ